MQKSLSSSRKVLKTTLFMPQRKGYAIIWTRLDDTWGTLRQWRNNPDIRLLRLWQLWILGILAGDYVGNPEKKAIFTIAGLTHVRKKTITRYIGAKTSVLAHQKLHPPETASSDLWLPCQLTWDWFQQKPHPRDYGFRANSPETAFTGNRNLGPKASVPARMRLSPTESACWGLCLPC